MATSEQPSAPSAHWEDFWRDAGGDGEVMGGDRQRPTLEAYWRDVFVRAGFGRADLILDIASGAAPIARIAAAALPADDQPAFLCADYAPAALTAARRAAGDGVLLVACDALRPPFRESRFAGIVSQYGLEYVGNAGFAAAARLLAPGGRLAAIVHYRDGVIESECAENARLVRGALDAGLIESAKRLLEASGPGAPGDSQSRAARDVRAAFETVGAILRAAPPSSARALVSRYAQDVARVAQRRAAFARDEAAGWIEAVGARLEAYAARMNAMVAAARDEGDMAEISGSLSREGLSEFVCAPLAFDPAQAPGAWRLEARRP